MDWEEIGKLLSILLVGLGGGVGGKWLLDAYRAWLKGGTVRRTEARRERADAFIELNDIIATLRADVGRADEKAERALRDEWECKQKWAKAISYIEYIGYMARAHGWDIRPWTDYGTDVHIALGAQSSSSDKNPSVNRPEEQSPDGRDRRKADDPMRKGPERRKARPPYSPEDQGRVEPHGPVPDLDGPDEITNPDESPSSPSPPPLSPDAESEGDR